MRRLSRRLPRLSSSGTPRALHSSSRSNNALGLADMPAPRGLPGVGTSLSFLLAGGPSRLHEYVDQRHRQLGPVFRDRIGPVSAVFVADPTEMRRVFALEGKYPMHILPEAWLLYNHLYGCKRGLLFMNGEEWLNTRRIMNRVMIKPDRSAAFGEPCRTTAKALVSQWTGSQVLEGLEEQLYRWSLDTLIATLVGSQYETHASKWRRQVDKLSAMVHHIFLESGRMSIISARYAQLLHLPVWSRFVNAVDLTMKEATDLVLQIKATCAAGPCEGLLSQLLDAGIPEKDVTRIVVDLIIAAGDTTALSMQWALYLLARHEQVQEEVLEDVLRHDDVTESLLLRGVVRETLRLHPVAPFLTRILPWPSVLGGYELPGLQLVLLSLYSSGRDPSNFGEPELFLPHRWIRDHERNDGSLVTSPYASLPFAMGARSCVGRKLAEVQMMTALAEVLKEFRLKLLNTEEIKTILRLVAVPSKPIRIALKARR